MPESLVYKLNVTYFDQTEDIQKLDQYMTAYSGKDVTVASTGDKAYTVTGHVPEKSLLVFNPVSVIAGISNLSKVKVTIGGETKETADAGKDGDAFMEFVASRIPYETNFESVVSTWEIVAGKVTAVYTITFATNYDQQAVVSEILDNYYKDGFDNDEIQIINNNADGISWIELKLKKAPAELTDQLGWVDMVKSIPYLATVEFSVDGATHRCVITDMNDPEQLAQLKSTMIAAFPVDDSIARKIGNIFYKFTNTGDNESHQSIVATMFFVESLVPHVTG